VPDSKPRIAITMGDPSGIGPEVTAAALASRRVREALIPVVFGDDRAFQMACRARKVPDRLERVRFGEQARGPSLVCVTALSASDSRPGRPTTAGASAQLAYLEAALQALPDPFLSGLCTAPISKAQVAGLGVPFSGHTELLAERFGARVVMMLVGPRLRVAVHTTHLPLSQVPKRISTKGIVADLTIIDRGLKAGFGIRRPRLAVCGLNPHAGDGGLFGDEEERIIAPAIAAARAARINASGPHPADGLFPRAAAGEYDAVLAMYHDQGLVALKLLHFDEGVNVTLGLPKPRTSPDHGVAYDLAGKGIARSRSMEEALLLAARMAARSLGAARSKRTAGA
jgi:4-hydroxythreonine-4-phosphate dehydrogenase